MSEPLFRRIDCLNLPVQDIEAALEFYRDKLGHQLVWRTENAAGLRMADNDGELVIREDANPPETDITVESAEEAARRFVEAGGEIVVGPFDIKIGKCVVVRDPWGNQLVLLDCTKGLLKTDDRGYVVD